MSHDTDLSRDVVHDAFTAVLARFDRVERPLPYLRRTIINGVRQRARSAERETRRVRTWSVTTDLEDLIVAALRDDARRAPEPEPGPFLTTTSTHPPTRPGSR